MPTSDPDVPTSLASVKDRPTVSISGQPMTATITANSGSISSQARVVIQVPDMGDPLQASNCKISRPKEARRPEIDLEQVGAQSPLFSAAVFNASSGFDWPSSDSWIACCSAVDISWYFGVD